MAENSKRKEHIVPSMILSEFVAPDGFLWVYEKDKPPRRSRPKNECVERDYFEYALRGKETNNLYENWLSQIESKAKNILNTFKKGGRISNEEAGHWAQFVASLFSRTRKYRDQISKSMTQRVREQTENPDSIRDIQYALLQKGELHFADDLKQAVTENRTAMETSPSFYHVSTLPKRTLNIAKLLVKKGAWHTIEAPPNAFFVFSDCPVMTYEERDGQVLPGVGFGHENTVAMLPISPKHLWVASPHHLKWRREATISGVNNINRLIVQFADRNVYANVQSNEIRTLVDKEINYLVFGENAFVPQPR
jgi:polyhydroxyalkanoate synthesis regulator phasin